MPVAETPEQREKRLAANERASRYYYANREKVQVAQKEYRLANREKAAAYNRRYHVENREAKIQKQKRYAAKNRAAILAYQAQWRAENRSRLAEQQRLYNLTVPEEVRLRRNVASALYRKQHLARYSAYAQKHRALKMVGAVDMNQIEEWHTAQRAKSSVVCYYCSRKFPSADLHVDHIVPLSRGGKHEISNLCVSCPRCNLTKNANLIPQWVKPGQQILSL